MVGVTSVLLFFNEQNRITALGNYSVDVHLSERLYKLSFTLGNRWER